MRRSRTLVRVQPGSPVRNARATLERTRKSFKSRTPACQAGDLGATPSFRTNGPVAQTAEQAVLTRRGEGSTPSSPTNAFSLTPPWMIGRAVPARDSGTRRRSDSRGVSGFGYRTTGRFDSCISYQCASSQRDTRRLHRGSVVQREDIRFAPGECRFESDRNPPSWSRPKIRLGRDTHAGAWRNGSASSLQEQGWGFESLRAYQILEHFLHIRVGFEGSSNGQDSRLMHGPYRFESCAFNQRSPRTPSSTVFSRMRPERCFLMWRASGDAARPITSRLEFDSRRRNQIVRRERPPKQPSAAGTTAATPRDCVNGLRVRLKHGRFWFDSRSLDHVGEWTNR